MTLHPPAPPPPIQMTLATYTIDDGSEKVHAMKENLMRYMFLAQASLSI